MAYYLPNLLPAYLDLSDLMFVKIIIPISTKKMDLNCL